MIIRETELYNPQAMKFDKVVSIGLCEHVGYKNYKRLFKIVLSNMKPDGLFLLHTIGKNHSIDFCDPWIQKYVFPQGVLPTIQVLGRASEPYFIIEDIHNFGADYDKTLMAWYENFKANWHELKSCYDEKFYRMWCYYLLSCAGGFRARSNQLFQIVFSPKGVINGYISIR